MKGEQVCHQHAQQADHERRREQQRREFLSRPAVGFASPNGIQHTIGELMKSLVAGRIDHKVAGRLLNQIQTAIRLQRIAARLPRKTARAATGRDRSRDPRQAGRANTQEVLRILSSAEMLLAAGRGKACASATYG
jgi:hypothetical protein